MSGPLPLVDYKAISPIEYAKAAEEAYNAWIVAAADVVLIGLAGVGKSCVSKALAAQHFVKATTAPLVFDHENGKFLCDVDPVQLVASGKPVIPLLCCAEELFARREGGRKHKGKHTLYSVAVECGKFRDYLRQLTCCQMIDCTKMSIPETAEEVYLRLKAMPLRTQKKNGSRRRLEFLDDRPI